MASIPLMFETEFIHADKFSVVPPVKEGATFCAIAGRPDDKIKHIKSALEIRHTFTFAPANVFLEYKFPALIDIASEIMLKSNKKMSEINAIHAYGIKIYFYWPAVNLYGLLFNDISLQNNWRKLVLSMNNEQVNNPMHGKTLEMILEHLVKHYGWEEMAERVRINCFYENPSIKSSLKFLRTTPWARKKVEDLYLESLS